MILDTNFIIDLMENNVDAVEKFEDMKKRKKSWGVTTPTIFELWHGIARSSDSEKEKAKVKKILESQIVIDLDTASAEKAGIIDGKLTAKGEKIEPVDSMIAGITLANRETLLTRNKKHFSRIKGLKIETY